MKNYITGASGFIGSKLLSRLPEGTERISHLNFGPLTLEDCDCFYFLSAYGNMATQTDKTQTVRSNVIDAVWALSAIRSNQFVYLSSSSVTLPVQTDYARTKRAGEEIVQVLARKPIIVRPYSVTGAGEQSAHLIPTLIRSCLLGEPMEIVLEPTHDFIDVWDLVDGILYLVRGDYTGVFEIGSGQPISNEYVLNLVETVTGKKANVKVVNSMRAYDNQEWFCKDPSMRRIGWKPRKTVEQSVREMVASFKP